MALFNDGPASGIADLQGHDSQLLDVAHVEGIDVTRKLALAQEELALELTTLLAEAPTLAPAAGTLPDGKYYAAAAWTNRAGEEGAASVAAAITTTASTFTARPSIAPANAQGWNVYVGVSPTSLVLQNASPMGVGQIWTQTSGLVTTGKLAPPGQAAKPATS